MKRWQRWSIGGVAVGVLGIACWHAGRGALGDPVAELGDEWHQGHRIVDRHGALLRELPSEIGRGRPIALEAMGDRLVIATIVSEDRRFFEHSGVDMLAVLRAMGQNARHVRTVSGASTITQQLVKLLDTEGQPTRRGRDVGVKLREAARAQNLEESMSKREILEAYLNRLGYGRGLIGPEAAAQGLFGVSASELSWAQAAMLAVLPRAPSYLDPYAHPERAQMRQRALLEALHEHGHLSDEDLARATSEALALRDMERPFEAPHLSEALRAGMYGGLADGPVTHTTLDGELQRDLEGLAASHQLRLADGRAHGAAVIVIDNANGEVLAYVGSPGWSDEEHGQVDMVRALRQPGSTLKPFVYALAFESGLQPTALLADVPTRFGERSGAYAPDNFDGGFAGPISAREALAGSLNVPAVRLAADLEEGALLDELRALGFDSLDKGARHYGLSLALGSGEVTLHALGAAFVTLARGGDRVPLRFSAPEAELGAEVENGVRVIAPDVAAAISDALSDPWAKLRGLGGRGPFDIGFPVAVKTGTSSGHRDTYAVGYTRERTLAVWIGNPDGSATDRLTGGSGAGPLFADAMRRAMRDIVARRPLWDEGLLVEASVCPLSGMPVSDACPDAVTRRLIPRHHQHGERCTLHHHASAVARAEAPWRCDPEGRDRVVLLPDAFADWLASQPAGAPGQDAEGLPWYLEGQLEGCGQTTPHALRIEDPAPGSVLSASRAAGGRIELAASMLGPREAAMQVEFVLDGRVVGKSSPPYRADVAATVGDHILEVRPSDARAPVRIAVSHFSVR